MDDEQFKKIHLLVVDDEAAFRNTLAKRLRKRGINAHQAESGETCLRMLTQHPMDVVVLDVKMPGMNGMAVLHDIKRDHTRIEVILLTGHTATQDGIDGIKAGAFDYLSKPVEFEHLLEKIRQAFDKKLHAAERQHEAEYKAHVEQQMIATERLAALGTLAAGMAHEINNPLAIINEAAGHMSLLLKKPELAQMPRKQDFEKALEKIQKGINRTRTITHQLLSGVRKQEPVLALIQLDELVDDTLELVRKEAADKEITLTRKTLRAPNAIWIDPNQLRQILINLLTNAVQATQRQGSITVHIDKDVDGISLAVSDTGKGIAKENMGKIFEPFFSDKAPGEGTGLGLFVTREIIDKLGGAIDVQSRVGVGTTVTLHIPTQKIERLVRESTTTRKGE